MLVSSIFQQNELDRSARMIFPHSVTRLSQGVEFSTILKQEAETHFTIGKFCQTKQ